MFGFTGSIAFSPVIKATKSIYGIYTCMGPGSFCCAVPMDSAEVVANAVETNSTQAGGKSLFYKSLLLSQKQGSLCKNLRVS